MQLALVILIGIVLGLGGYTFLYAKGEQSGGVRQLPCDEFVLRRMDERPASECRDLQ
jgi:hypothetical protein